MKILHDDDCYSKFRLSVDYTAYISDIYDFDHNSWLQTRFAALEKYGYAAPFNVRGNISGTYRKYKE